MPADRSKPPEIGLKRRATSRIGSRKWPIDCQRNALCCALVSILLQGVAASRAIIANDSPLTWSRISCAPRIEIARGDAHHILVECDGLSAGDIGYPKGKGNGDKKGGAKLHAIAPAMYRPMPARQQAASVGIMPTLNRKMAIAAATESKSAQRLTLAGLGASKDRGKARTGIV
jgi:hypothetical protein